MGVSPLDVARRAVHVPWTTIPQGRTVELPDRGSTYVTDTPGPTPDAPAILLLHALGCTGLLTWFPAIDPLAERFRVITLDQRCHGRGIGTDDLRPADCADEHGPGREPRQRALIGSITVGAVRASDVRLREHVARIATDHPPLRLEDVDYTIHDPVTLERRYGHVLDYMARVELEVDRNVLELITMLPDPPEIDRQFYADVWQPQEIQHGLILDRLQIELGRPAAIADTDTVSMKLRVLGALAHLAAFQDVCRMLYYLTGMATERSAVLAYNLLHDGVRDLGELAVAETVVAPIKRQEPGHFVFYQLSARGLWAELAPWQKWLVRRMRTISFGPVGTNNDEQRADFGDLMTTLGITPEHSEFVASVVRVERELLWAHHEGVRVPRYVLKAFREAAELAEQRAAAGR